MPANHLFVPFLRLIFPRAVIVHMRRDPLDTALSCFEAGFAFGIDYAARFDTLGQAYRMYADLMAEWTALPGVRLRDVVYERLVDDTGTVLRGVLSQCRLAWDPACLAPAVGGQIKTASVTQARAVVNTRSVGRWRVHAERLAPMIAAMGGAAWVEAESVRQAAGP